MLFIRFGEPFRFYSRCVKDIIPIIIDFLQKKSDIKGVQEIEELEKDLLQLAEETDVRLLPAYEPVPREKLIRSIEKINTALAPLNDNDKAEFISNEGTVEFNLSLYIAPETIEDLITADIIESSVQMIIKVKKPDFLGTSQWEFRHDTCHHAGCRFDRRHSRRAL